MSGHVEIDFEDIKRGDAIRVENKRRREGLAFSIEYVASYDGFNWYEDSGYGHTYYLLDRPAPAVTLPSTPTLGWATHANDGQLFGLFSQNPSTRQIVDCVTCDWGRFSWEPSYVTAFTPATAVPTAALDELRANVDCSGPLSCLREHVETFLAAVDNASTR